MLSLGVRSVYRSPSVPTLTRHNYPVRNQKLFVEMCHMIKLPTISMIISRLNPTLQLHQQSRQSGNAATVQLPPQWYHNAQLRRQFLEILIDRTLTKTQGDKQCMIERMAALDSMGNSDLINAGGGEFLKLYNRSAICAIYSEYPEHAWKMWNRNAPKAWWSDLSGLFAKDDPIAIAVVSLYIEDLAKEFGINRLEDWHSVGSTQPFTNRIAKLGQLPFVLSRLYPEHKWRFSATSRSQELQPFRAVNSEFWKEEENRREYLDFLKNQIGGTYEDMYHLNHNHILQTGGISLLSYFNGSTAMAVMVTYKEHSWKPWKFERTPHGWWSELAAWFAAGDTYATAALREYILDIAQELQIKSMEEWHNVTPEKLRPSHSRHLDYLGRLPKVLKRLYPTYPWKFVIHEEKLLEPFGERPPPPSWWNDMKNQRAYMDHLKAQLGGTMEDLYKATQRHFLQTHGAAILPRYNYSVAQTIMSVYNEHPWKVWKFLKPPSGWWQITGMKFAQRDAATESTVREWIESLAKTYEVKQLEDWYRVSREQLGPANLEHLDYLGRLETVLRRLYPDHEWHSGKFQSSAKRAVQRTVREKLKTYFPNEDAIEEATTKDLNMDELPEQPIRFDIAYPKLKLIIEYHGQHHYHETHFGELQEFKRRDAIKAELCKRHDYTLIIVPYWWEHDTESLLNTIHYARPDLIPSPVGDGNPIPATQPPPQRRSKK